MFCMNDEEKTERGHIIPLSLFLIDYFSPCAMCIPAKCIPYLIDTFKRCSTNDSKRMANTIYRKLSLWTGPIRSNNNLFIVIDETWVICVVLVIWWNSSISISNELKTIDLNGFIVFIQNSSLHHFCVHCFAILSCINSRNLLKWFEEKTKKNHNTIVYWRKCCFVKF